MSVELMRSRTPEVIYGIVRVQQCPRIIRRQYVQYREWEWAGGLVMFMTGQYLGSDISKIYIVSFIIVPACPGQFIPVQKTEIIKHKSLYIYRRFKNMYTV